MKSELPLLGDAHARAIAHVSIRSAQLDHIIEIALDELLLPKEKTAEKIVKNWGHSQQIGLINSLLLDIFPWYQKQIDDFILKINEARKDRNKIIHHLWGDVDDGGAATLASYRPYRDPKKDSKTAENVMDVADELFSASLKLHHVIFWCREQRIASHDKRAPLLPQGDYPFPLDHDLPDKPEGT